MNNKIEEAFRKNEVKELLLGDKGYAIVYPHFFSLLKTDTTFVLKSIEDAIEFQKLEKGYEQKINEALLSLCDNTENCYYLLNYLYSYLSEKKNSFILDVKEMVKKINKFLENDFNPNQNLNGVSYKELYGKLIVGFEGISGNWNQGINNFLEKEKLIWEIAGSSL